MKLLVLLSRFPYPLDKGDKLRAFHQLRQLAERHEVCLFALSEGDVSAADQSAVAPYCAGGIVVHRLSKARSAAGVARALATGLPLQVGYFYDRGAQRRLDRLIATFQPDHVYAQLIRTAHYLRGHRDGRPSTLDYMDAFSSGMLRRTATAKRWQRPILAREGRRLQEYEAEAFGWFGGHTMITDQDRRLIAHPRRLDIAVVPNGIDTTYFTPEPTAPTHDLLFCGNLSYPPNVDAASLLAEEVLPQVRRRHPGARLMLAGTTPAPRVRALASAEVTVTGWLDDIRTAYAAARVFVAPMRIGTGLQNKLLEAMAMERPCVTTPLANDALQGRPEEDLLVGSAEETADLVIRLLDDPAYAAAVGSRGRTFVRERYDWKAATARLEAVFARRPETSGSGQPSEPGSSTPDRTGLVSWKRAKATSRPPT